MTDVVLPTTDGERLQGIHNVATGSRGVIVLCHPHPEQGGTMRAPILGAIAKHAVAQGLDVLRFNFRGVGESTGTHGRGEAELHDVEAAMTYAADLDLSVVGLAGWSFGAVVALRWQAETGSTAPFAGIAPPVRSEYTPTLPEPAALQQARRGFIVGDRDQFVDSDELAQYAASISAKIVQYPGTDHFFVFKHQQLAEDVVTMITDETV